MHALILVTALAFMSGSFAQFNPFTVTSVTPEQASAVEDAENSILASITALPEFTSIVYEIASNTQAFDALTQLLGQPLPTGTQGEAELNSIFDQLPPDAQSFFRSLTAAEGSIESSIIYAGSSAGGSEPSETGPASAGATATAAVTTPAQLPQPSLTSGSSNTLPQSSPAPSITGAEGPQTSLSGSTPTTLTSSYLATNSSLSASLATFTGGAAALVHSGGVDLALLILGVGIMAL